MNRALTLKVLAGTLVLIMVASAFPLADVVMRMQDDAAGDGRDDGSTGTPSPSDLPFPPGASDGAADSGSNPDDASSVPGSIGVGASSSAGTGSALLDQVLGAARMAGIEAQAPPLPVDKIAAVNPLRAAILEWVTVTASDVSPSELETQLARADALPATLQRDLALLILSAAEATRLQNAATALIPPEQLQWIRANPQVASDMARGVDSFETRHLAFLAGLVDTEKSVQAALLLVQAAEATRGSLAGAKLDETMAALDEKALDPRTAEILKVIAGAGSGVDDASKLRYVAQLVSVTTNVPVPAAPAGSVSFEEAVAALLSATGATPDLPGLDGALARAAFLPADLQRALALPILAQARAIDASNPLYLTSAGQTEALLGVLVAVAEALPTLEKYNLYWRTAPDALRVSAWDRSARIGWATEHAAMLATTRGFATDVVRAGGVMQGLGLLDATVPQRGFVDAFEALMLAGGLQVTDAQRDTVRSAGETLAPEVRDAAAILMSGAAESARLTNLAFADLSDEERASLLTGPIDLTSVLQTASPTGEQLDELARLTALAERVDRALLVEAGIVGASATLDAKRLLTSGTVSTQSSRVTPVDTGLLGILSRLLPFGTASAQGAPCVPFSTDTVPVSFGGIQVDNDCANDVLLRIKVSPLAQDGGFSYENDMCTEYETSNDELLVITGTRSTSHEPPRGSRLTGPWGSRSTSTMNGQTTVTMCTVAVSTAQDVPVPRWGAPFVALDLGGDDTYLRPAAMTTPGTLLPVSLHLDIDGTDVYMDPTSLYDSKSPIYRYLTTRANGHPTQGSAVGGGVAVLVDVAGDDRYEAPSMSQGFARLGVGMLVDGGGKDAYFGRTHVQGAASENWAAGIGALVDVAGDDTYRARTGQGYGFGGILVDTGGVDDYRAEDEPAGVPIVKLDVLPGGDLAAFDGRGDGRLWIDGPAGLNPGIAIDVDTSQSSRDNDQDSDFVEFVLGTDPDDPDSNSLTEPTARVDLIAADEDGDTFPDFIERALSTDPQDASSYPAGIPRGPKVLLPQTGPIVPGDLVRDLQVEDAPESSDKFIDLRMPLQDAGSIERACTGEVDVDANISFGTTLSLLDNAGLCSFLSYQSNGDGTGNGTLPSNPQATDPSNGEFNYRFPAGILAVGDSIATRYDVDYFLTIDLGGNDVFRNHAGGPLTVRTDRKDESKPADHRDVIFNAPSLVLNVDVALPAGAGGLQSPEDGEGVADDMYLKPVNGTGDLSHGALLGILIDTAGNDRYVAGDVSQGAMGGLLLDLGGLFDSYSAGNLSQGAVVGDLAAGTRGFPESIDATGQVRDGQSLSLLPPAILADFGGLDTYVAGAHSQGYGAVLSPDGQNATAGILLDVSANELELLAIAAGTGFADFYWAKGEDSQGVGGRQALGILADLGLGNDVYKAKGFVSQGATVSQTRATPTGSNPSPPGGGFLLDFGGLDNYTYVDARNRDVWRTDFRQNTTTIQRGSTGVENRYYVEPGVHLDGDVADTNGGFVNAVAGIGSRPGESAAADSNTLIDLPTARLAIGSDAPTTYDREYALVIDLGGNNVYDFNAGGFVPDLLSRAPGSEGQSGGYAQTLSLYPVSFVLDAGRGASTYTAPDLLAQGAGFFSVGILVDAGGADVLTALPEERWTAAASWLKRSVTTDGFLTADEWENVQPFNITLEGTLDPRYAHDYQLRLANDHKRLYMTIEGPTLSEGIDVFRDDLIIDLNPGRTMKEYDPETLRTGIDEIRVNLSHCVIEDWQHNGAAYVKDKRWYAPDGTLMQDESLAAQVLGGCRIVDGRWHVELTKPIEPGYPLDLGDMILPYDEKHGFLGDLDVGIRIQLYESATGEYYAFPPATSRLDGNHTSIADGNLTDEMSAWGVFSLANKGEQSPVPRATRVASLSQGAGLAGVGIVAMLGTTDSAATYTSADRSQAFAAFGGLGVLVDAAGDDTYLSADYSQAASGAQGVALLVDLDGNDHYVSTTRSNGYTSDQQSAATFLDIHGYDAYDTPGFTVGPIPDCQTESEADTVYEGCNLEQNGVQHAKGNEQTWTQGPSGRGMDLFTTDSVRGRIGGIYDDALFGASNTKISFYRLTSASDACDGSATSDATRRIEPEAVTGKPVLTGAVCVRADVNVSQGPGASIAAAAVSVDSVDVLVNHRMLGQMTRGSGDDADAWFMPLDTTRFDDGVTVIAGLAILRVQPAADSAGAVLLMDNIGDDREGTSFWRAILNNKPSIQAEVGPIDEVFGGALFSPGVRNLLVNWSVSRDGNEDRLEAVDDFAPEARGRNVPCANPLDERLCNLLPFFLRSGADFDTNRGQDASRPVMERATADPILSQTSPAIDTDLAVTPQDGFVLHLPDRTPVLPGDFETRVVITLYNGSDPVEYNGEPVVLAQGTWGATRNPTPSDLVGGLAGPFEAVRSVIDNATNVSVDSALLHQQGVTLFEQTLCKNGQTASIPAGCEQLYGDYGWGGDQLRICSNVFSVWTTLRSTDTTAEAAFRGTGLCDENTPANLTLRTLRDVTIPEEATAPADDAVKTVGSLFATTDPSGEGWTLFRLAPQDVPLLGYDADSGADLVIPAGRNYRIHFDMWTDKDGVEGAASFNELYRGTVLPPIIDIFEGPVGEALNVTLPQGSNFNLTNTIRGQVEAATFTGLDGILENPIPVAFFSYGGPRDEARLEVRTPTQPQTRVIIDLVNQAGQPVATLHDDLAVGDLEGTPTDAYFADGLWQYRVVSGLRRYTEHAPEYTVEGVPDGRYNLRIRAHEPYSDVTDVVTRPVLLDQTSPVTSVTTPTFVPNPIETRGLPIVWSVDEQGSGIRDTYVYAAAFANDATPPSFDINDCTSPAPTLIGRWKLVDAFPQGTFSAAWSAEPSVTRAYFVSIGVDRAGNVESARTGTVCEALHAKVNAGSVTFVQSDAEGPTGTLSAITGAATRQLAFKGRDVTFVRANDSVEFSVCVGDTGGGGIKTVNLVLTSLEVAPELVANYSYVFAATRSGACSDGNERWVSSSWGSVNWNKTLFPDGFWAVSYDIYDTAGNKRTLPAASLILDATAPDVTLGAIGYPIGQSAAKPGDIVQVRVRADDAYGVDTRAIRVDASAVNATGVFATKSVRVDDVVWQQAEFRVDKSDIVDGIREIRVTVADNAGNLVEEKLHIVLDVKEFEIVEGSLEVVEVTHNTATIRWQTTENTTGVVRFGPSPAELRFRTDPTENLTTDHEVTITGLSASSRYFFRALSSSAGGFTKETDVVQADTLTALYLDLVGPAADSAVSGVVDVVFEGGLRDADDFVTYTLYVKQPHKAENWTFVTTITRKGDEHAIPWNSSRYLDGAGYALRVTAEAGRDVREITVGPLTADNAAPLVNVLTPLSATNTTRPAVHVEVRDALSGFGPDNAVLRIDGETIEEGVSTERTGEGLRVRYEVASPLTSGAHTFELEVADRAGNLAHKTWNVFVDGDAPVIRQNALGFTPGTTAAKRGGQVLLNLTITDASGIDVVTADPTALEGGESAVRLHRVDGTDRWTAALRVGAADEEALKAVRVTAIDLAGNVRTATVNVPIDNVAPAVADARAIDVGHTTATIVAGTASEPVRLVASATARDAPQAGAAEDDLTRTPRVTITGLLPSRTYDYTLRAIDGAGNEATLAGRFQTAADEVPPGTVGGLEVLDLQNGTLRLMWTPAEDDIGIAFYRIYRSADEGATFEPIAEVSTTRYDDGERPFDKSFTYQVVAVDHGGNEGVPSNSLEAAATAVPGLSAGTASPTLGTTSTIFRYTITYTSASGRAPTSVRVIIDGAPHEMTLVDGDLLGGATYAFETRLAPHMRDAPHTYSYEATDGRYTVKFPLDGSVLRGPLVSPDAAGSEEAGFASFAQRVPVGGMAGVTLAIVAAALMIALLARKKKGGSQ